MGIGSSFPEALMDKQNKQIQIYLNSFSTIHGTIHCNFVLFEPFFWTEMGVAIL